MDRFHLQDKDVLRGLLRRIDGRGYKAYKDIEGAYHFEKYTLIIDHVQGDPFASPSRIRVQVGQEDAGFPRETFQNKSREVALRDFITRKFSAASLMYGKGNRGTGKSGAIFIDKPGQEILERSSVLVNSSKVESRFFIGLPAYGRKIAGRHAESMFFEELPRIVEASSFYDKLDKKALFLHIQTVEDADQIRNQLDRLGLVAFVADGAVLPRASGVDSRPLAEGRVVPFESPESLRVRVETPNRGQVAGMGIPRGVTLIVGGGFHGKSTLLSALQLGIYNHVPGDGRELVVSSPGAVKIRAEDGRRIEKVDISPFISNLPFERQTRMFSTEDASGSTSQAANTIEALEVGGSVLLIDEDTSATNFMIRDQRMQELVTKDKEPITPFIDKIRPLFNDHGVSTILVIGGSGDYFDVADCVVCMVAYRPQDMTQEARSIAEKYRAERMSEGGAHFSKVTRRIPQQHSLDPSKGKRPIKISVRGISTILFGVNQIDLNAVEQLVDSSQTRAIGDALQYAKKYMDGNRTLSEIVSDIQRDISERGFDVLSPRRAGDYAEFRELEFAAALNRLRTLSVKQERE